MFSATALDPFLRVGGAGGLEAAAALDRQAGTARDGDVGARGQSGICDSVCDVSRREQYRGGSQEFVRDIDPEVLGRGIV